ncbi:hypothetical protein [Serratia fonticola]|uniref:hypothetical protein n=1 Tax=Serratia fonticola TaxID=47917 RepID=UPI0004651E99|nr:hypothetical protein [Serratia fonticola]
MKRIMIVAALVALSGCGTVNDLKQNTPAISGSTDKTVQEYTACVLSEWNKHTYLQPVLTQPLSNGNALIFDEPFRGPVFILDVEKVGDGSEFKLYKSRDISYYEKPITSCK